MASKRGRQSQRFRVSLDAAIQILGDSSKSILIQYIMKRYGVTQSRARECSVIELELVLRNILGPGAAIIIERMHQELVKLDAD